MQVQELISKKRLDWASGIVIGSYLIGQFCVLAGIDLKWNSSDIDWKSVPSILFGVSAITLAGLIIWSAAMVWFHGFFYWRWRYASARSGLRLATLLLVLAFPWGPLALYFVGYRGNSEYDNALNRHRKSD